MQENTDQKNFKYGDCSRSVNFSPPLLGIKSFAPGSFSLASSQSSFLITVVNSDDLIMFIDKELKNLWKQFSKVLIMSCLISKKQLISWKHPLRKKCPNTEFFLVRIFLYSETFHAVHLTCDSLQLLLNCFHFKESFSLSVRVKYFLQKENRIRN